MPPSVIIPANGIPTHQRGYYIGDQAVSFFPIYFHNSFYRLEEQDWHRHGHRLEEIGMGCLPYYTLQVTFQTNPPTRLALGVNWESRPHLYAALPKLSLTTDQHAGGVNQSSGPFSVNFFFLSIPATMLLL